MRKIKFKFWDKDNKEMSEVCLLGDDLRWLHSDMHVPLQYTGLLDKNGKEIYEGDILKFNTKGGNEMIYEVKWRGKGFKPTRMSEDNQEEIEIIGNIYENPELLSGN